MHTHYSGVTPLTGVSHINCLRSELQMLSHIPSHHHLQNLLGVCLHNSTSIVIARTNVQAVRLITTSLLAQLVAMFIHTCLVSVNLSNCFATSICNKTPDLFSTQF